jgi:iron complex transport system substrate-binding protein
MTATLTGTSKFESSRVTVYYYQSAIRYIFNESSRTDGTYTVDYVLSDPNLADCDAVKNGKVYKMPSKAEAWDSPVPSGSLGAVWLSSVLHSDICTEAAAAEIIDNYYETFYDFKYSEK